MLSMNISYKIVSVKIEILAKSAMQSQYILHKPM